jgi:glycerol-3-phosphate acyltransferase PlsY
MLPIALSIPAAYLLGSVSSASIIAWLFGRIDMRKEPDGRVSAAEVYNKLGLLPFSLVVILDALFPFSAVVLTGVASDWSTNYMMLAGIAALAGHNWSIFIKFKGGLGATAILGIMLALASLQFLIGMAIGGIVMLITRRSSLATVTIILSTSIILFINRGLGILPVYPLFLLSLMLIKRYQVKKLADLA